MTGPTQLRLAALCAMAHALLAASGLVHHFQRTGSLRVLLRGLMQPQLWIVLLVAGLVTFGLFRRQAWAWWLGVAAAAFGVYRIVASWLQAGHVGQLPGAATLIALALLLLTLVLLAPRKARLAANR